MEIKNSGTSLAEIAYQVKNILSKDDEIFELLGYRPNQIEYTRGTIAWINPQNIKPSQLDIDFGNPKNEGDYASIFSEDGNYFLSAWRDETAPYRDTLMGLIGFQTYDKRFEQEIAVFPDLVEKMLDLGLFREENLGNKAADLGLHFLETEEMRDNIRHRVQTAEGEALGIKWLDRGKSEFRINVPSQNYDGSYNNVRRIYRRLPDVSIDDEEYVMFGRVANATSVTRLGRNLWIED